MIKTIPCHHCAGSGRRQVTTQAGDTPGERLRHLRHSVGMTLAEVSRAIDVPIHVIHYVEHNRMTFDARVARLCEFYGVTREDVYGARE
jgi:transcriptional regulator with XRE-family HTH domain